MWYELIVEEVVPLGPEPYKKHFEEVNVDDPEEYVKSRCKMPIVEIDVNQYGEKVITCSDGKWTSKFSFSEC